MTTDEIREAVRKGILLATADIADELVVAYEEDTGLRAADDAEMMILLDVLKRVRARAEGRVPR